MYVEALHVKDVRLFTELNIQFNRKFNFLAGPNGCGKTSALVCIAHCFHVYGLEYSRYGKEAEFWTDLAKDGIKHRVGLGRGCVKNKGYRQYPVDFWVAPPSEQNRTSLSSPEVKDKLQTSPLFIGAKRTVSYQQIQGIHREKPKDEALEEYSQNSIRSLYGEWQTNIKQWIITRYFMTDKEWAETEKTNWEHFKRQLPKIAPFKSNFSYVKTLQDFEPIFSLYGEECYLEELSAGYQAVLSLIVNIFAWIEATNEGENRIVANAKGTVLIDEPDIHLHPEWQLTLREGLANLFPNIQFILTTHSPHLLSSAAPEEVIVMPKYYTEDVYDLKPREKSFSGWKTDDILREIMGVESLDNKERSKLFNVALSAINNKNTVELKRTISELEKICHPNDTIVTELTLKCASIEALYGESGDD